MRKKYFHRTYCNYVLRRNGKYQPKTLHAAVSTIRYRFAVVVGAIDFGTTYSTWAFSFKTDYERDPTVASAKHWISRYASVATEKTPTCLLVKPDGKTFEAFGYEAEDKYIGLADTNSHTDYYYFRRFKMSLFKCFGQDINRYMTIEDELGKKLFAIDVFALSIKYLLDDMKLTLEKQLIGEAWKCMRLVLTVPAIWSDAGKQFMKEAAIKAGMDKEKITIALEPEAASIFCRHLPLEVTGESGEMSISKLPVGTQYIVVDAGGGTIDITVHEIHDYKTLREVKRASGGNWGGIMVDKAFEDFLVNLLGKAVVEEFKKTEMEDWMCISREFELIKREAGRNLEARIRMHLPISLIDLYATMTKTNMRDTMKASNDAAEMELKGDKFSFSRSLLHGFFDDSVKNTISHMKALLNDKTMKDVKYILMVGGYSGSTILQEAVKEAFPDRKVIIPRDTSSAVLRGSLIFGHNPMLISERKVKYTYGTKSSSIFKDGDHPNNKRVKTDRGDVCIDVFDKFIERDTSVRLGATRKTKRFTTLDKKQSYIRLEIYASEGKDPKYVDDEGCVKIGEVVVDLEDPDDEPDREVHISMLFGGTEIFVETEDKKTGNKKITTVNFLG